MKNMRDILNILNELSIPRNRDSAEVVLMKAGYVHLGRGSKGAVYQKPGASYVVKLFDKSDAAYLDFIRLAQANPNPHFPKFIGKPVKVTHDYYAIRTERLEPYEKHVIVGLINKYIIKKRDQLQGINGDWADAYDYVSSKPQLKLACDLIAVLLKDNDTQYFCDVHEANVMKRGETIVLSDPVSTVSSK